MASDRLCRYVSVCVRYNLLASACILRDLTCLPSAVYVIMTLHDDISLQSLGESCQSEHFGFFEIAILERNEVVSRPRRESRMIANVWNLAL